MGTPRAVAGWVTARFPDWNPPPRTTPLRPVLFWVAVVAALAALVPAEVFAAGAWEQVAPMSRDRRQLAAVTGRDGRIYAIGGLTSTASPPHLASVEAYSPDTNTWTAVAPMPNPRFLLAAAAGADGRIYAIGGRDNRGNFLNTVEAYTPATNTWTPTCQSGTEPTADKPCIRPMPTPRSALAAAAGPDGKIYAIGGDGADTGARTTVEAYDPTTNKWTTVAPMKFSRFSLGAATGADGRIYAIGGRSASVTTDGVEVGRTETVEAYTPCRTGSNSPCDYWKIVAPMSTVREGLAATAGSDGRVYALGGMGPATGVGFFDNAKPVATVEAYTPCTGNNSPCDYWKTVEPMCYARTSLAAALGPGRNGRVYAIGGSGGRSLECGGVKDDALSTTLSSVEAYRPTRLRSK